MKYTSAPLTPFLATLPQDAPVGSPRHSLVSNSTPLLSICASIACALLNSLAALFSTAVVCFQSFADSFAKTPGVGVLFANAPAPQFRLAPVFKNLQIPPPATSISMPRVFIYLEIPHPATTLFSHRYKSPGCGVTRERESPRFARAGTRRSTPLQL